MDIYFKIKLIIVNLWQRYGFTTIGRIIVY